MALYEYPRHRQQHLPAIVIDRAHPVINFFNELPGVELPGVVGLVISDEAVNPVSNDLMVRSYGLFWW